MAATELNNSSKLYHYLALSLLLILSSLSEIQGLSTRALTFELPDNQEICFHEPFDRMEKYIFEYKVVRGGKRDVDVYVLSPNGKIIYKEARSQQAKFEFESSTLDGDFTFCFSNKFSALTHKIVYFELTPEDESSLALEAGDTRSTVQTQVEASMERIHRSHSKVLALQTRYRLRESNGRYQADMLNSGVQLWSLGQTFFIILAGFGQVIVLKTFFTDKKPLTLKPLADSSGVSQSVPLAATPMPETTNVLLQGQDLEGLPKVTQ